MEITPSEPDIRWRPTWPPDHPEYDPNDFVALAGPVKLGRIYPVSTQVHGVIWKWFAWFECRPNSGQTESMLAAMLAIEDGYNASHEDRPAQNPYRSP